MVYVDNFNAPFGRMKMCHMIADTTEELLAMVDKIGVQRKWIQYPGTANEHFDICLGKKAKALFYGAKEINFRDYAKKVSDREEEMRRINLIKESQNIPLFKTFGEYNKWRNSEVEYDN